MRAKRRAERRELRENRRVTPPHTLPAHRLPSTDTRTAHISCAQAVGAGAWESV
jgi:hypothetical protein